MTNETFVKRFQDILAAFPQQTVLGLGDLMLDQYRRATTTALSPEAPTLDLINPGLTETPGGAANVAWNISNLGGKVFLAGVVGEDREAESLKKILAKENGVDFTAVADPTRPTTLKLRFYHEQAQILRISQESRDSLSPEIAQKCIGELDQRLKSASVLFVEDYGKGVVREEVVNYLSRLRKENSGLTIIFDPKVGNEKYYQPGMCTLLKPNWKEACHLAKADQASAKPEDVAKKLGEFYQCDVLVTLGPKGSVVFEKSSGKTVMVPTRSHEAFDVAGAGDTVVATLSLALAAGASLVEAAFIANIAAGIVVEKSGTAFATREEILEELKEPETVKNIQIVAEKLI